MDTKKECKIPKCGTLPDLTGFTVVVGAKQLKKALSGGKAKQVYLAKNADPAITEPIEALCQQTQVAYTWVRTMTELGHACGIEVGAAAAATLQ